MTKTHHEVLWHGFPKTLLEFEERFATEEACREYVAACRWNGRPRCHQCDSDRVWSTRGHALRVRIMWPSDEPDVGHVVSRHAQATAALVPGDMGDLRAPPWHLGG